MTRMRIGALFAATAIILAACGGATPSSAPSGRADGRRLDRAIDRPVRRRERPEGGWHARRRHPGRHQPDRPRARRRRELVVRPAADHRRPGHAQAGHRQRDRRPAGRQLDDQRRRPDLHLQAHGPGSSSRTARTSMPTAVKVNFDRWMNIPKTYTDLGYTYYIDTVIPGKINVASTAPRPDRPSSSTLKAPNSAFLVTADADPVRLLEPEGPGGRQGERSGLQEQHVRPGRPAGRRRHRPVHVQGMGPGRPRDARPRTRTTGTPPPAAPTSTRSPSSRSPTRPPR